MAQQAVRKQAETEAPRRRAARVPAVKTGMEPIDYTRWRITINDPDQFMAFMRDYPNKQGVTLFLYRLLPKIDLTLIQLQESNIQKGGCDDLAIFAQEAVAEKWGRGKYNIRMTDSNRPDGQRQVIQTCQYKLLDVEKPPVYDVRTLLLGHSDNIDEVNRLIAMGVLVRDAGGAPRLRTAADSPIAATAPPPAATPSDATATGLLYQIAVEAFKSSRQSPADHVKDTIEIAKLMRDSTPQTPQPSIDQIADAVVARMGGGRGPSDPFAGWERVQAFVERIGGGAANPAPAAPVATGETGAAWAPYAAEIMREARAFWPQIIFGIQTLRGNREKKPEQQQNGVPMLPLHQRIETIFKSAFQSMQRGITGAQFAAWLCMSGEFPGGLEAFEFLKPGGAAGVVTMAGTHPMGVQVLNDAALRAQLEVFLGDFFSFDPRAAASLDG
jgi:hypothetical protein